MSKWKTGMPITVMFRQAIRSDGEITRVKISQGEVEIQLTELQTKSLISRLAEKFPTKDENEQTRG